MSDRRIVQTPQLFKIDDVFDDPRYMKVRVAAMHSGENLNHSSFDIDVIKKAKESFSNIPILANTVTTIDSDGNQKLDYGQHDMHIEDDVFNEGEQRVIYDEKVVGVVPEKNNFEIIHDEETGNDYVWVDALIYRDYGNYCADILESRGGTTSVSAEINCDEISVDAKNQCIVVNKMTMCAITLLGEDVKPGMKKAHATTFDMKDNDRTEQMLRIMQELRQSLDNYISAFAEETKKEGGNPVDAEIKDMTTEEVEDTALLSEVEETDESEVVTEPVEEETENVEVVDKDPVTEEPSEPEVTEEPIATEDDVDETIVVDDEEKKKRVNHSVEFNGVTKTFAVSLQDKIYALTSLVNETYGDDGSWYDVTVYDDDKYVIMVDWWQGKAWKQAYKTKKDNYSLVGDRVEVFSQWLTQDEINKLEDLRANYAEASEKLAKYEAEPEKMQILESEDYSSIADVEEFVTLKTQEAHFDMSVDEVRAEADKILLNAAKNGKVDFSAKDATEKTHATFVPLITSGKSKSGRYGGIFKK